MEPNTLSAQPLILHSQPFINTIYQRLSTNRDLLFLIDGEDGKRHTFGDLLEGSIRWASWLRSKGLGKGDIVSISSENNMYGFCVKLGTWLSGAAANPINFNFTAGDIKGMFQCTEPNIIYCSKNIEAIEQAVEELGYKIPIVTAEGKYPYIDIKSIMKLNVENFEPFSVDNSDEHIASILFTSGTTGTPKGIQITDSTLKTYPESSLVNIAFKTESSMLGPAPLTITSPMFWVSNLIGFSYTLFNCTPIAIPKVNWTEEDILKTISTYKSRSWFTGHSVLFGMMDKPYLDKYDLSCLESVTTGGTMLMGNQRREINEKVFKNNLTIKHLYGSTEVGIVTCWTAGFIGIDTKNTDEYNSVGTIERGVTLKIMSVDGRQLGPRQEGEIWIKTRAMTPGYMTLGRQIKSALDENGWYHSGDIGFYDEKKLLYIVGRLKDILKYRGFQIAPVEIESVLNEHANVLESCVVGKFDVIDGDQPVAFVVLKEFSTITENQLLQYCKERLAQVKWPTEVRIMESLPKSAVGKILRADLEKLLN